MGNEIKPMSPQELAEARELESRATAGPWFRGVDLSAVCLGGGRSTRNGWAVNVCKAGSEGISKWGGSIADNFAFIAAARTLVPRLLATVDALTQRAERAEAERDSWREACKTNGDDLDRLTEAAGFELPYEGFNEDVSAEIRRMRKATDERDAFKQELQDARERWKAAEHREDLAIAECDEALALADTRGRALETLLPYTQQLNSGSFNGMPIAATSWPYDVCWKALQLTAPEALRQQQEREAGKDALIEELEGALAVSEYHRDKAAKQAGKLLRAKPVHRITPAALARQREYVGALERVVEAARAWHESCIDVAPHNDAECEASERFQDALAALDAVKGGQS
jgi:hypothetical protein